MLTERPCWECRRAASATNCGCRSSDQRLLSPDCSALSRNSTEANSRPARGPLVSWTPGLHPILKVLAAGGDDEGGDPGQPIWSVLGAPPLGPGHALWQVGGQCRLCAVTPASLAQRRAVAPPASASASAQPQPLLMSLPPHPAPAIRHLLTIQPGLLSGPGHQQGEQFLFPSTCLFIPSSSSRMQWQGETSGSRSSRRRIWKSRWATEVQGATRSPRPYPGQISSCPHPPHLGQSGKEGVPVPGSHQNPPSSPASRPQCLQLKEISSGPSSPKGSSALAVSPTTAVPWCYRAPEAGVQPQTPGWLSVSPAMDSAYGPGATSASCRHGTCRCRRRPSPSGSTVSSSVAG